MRLNPISKLKKKDSYVEQYSISTMSLIMLIVLTHRLLNHLNLKLKELQKLDRGFLN